VVAKQHVVSRFWELLHDFLAVSAAPAQWCDALPPDHPFLRVVEGATTAGRRGSTFAIQAALCSLYALCMLACFSTLCVCRCLADLNKGQVEHSYSGGTWTGSRCQR
jgi:hypothetical protein